jgi:hypothetical protein
MRKIAKDKGLIAQRCAVDTPRAVGKNLPPQRDEVAMQRQSRRVALARPTRSTNISAARTCARSVLSGRFCRASGGAISAIVMASSTSGVRRALWRIVGKSATILRDVRCSRRRMNIEDRGGRGCGQATSAPLAPTPDSAKLASRIQCAAHSLSGVDSGMAPPTLAILDRPLKHVRALAKVGEDVAFGILFLILLTPLMILSRSR